MAFPGVARIELPVLHELAATGGSEDVRFLYARLVAYFPQLTQADIAELGNGRSKQWRSLVQRAGRALDEKRLIKRRCGYWTLTEQGRARASEEDFSLPKDQKLAATRTLEFSHGDIQQMLLDIGRSLGYRSQREFEYYDVVWRESEASPRLSHVFEVQRKGNIDAALAKLKRAYDAQRSKPYLIVASERDTNRAQKSLSVARTGAFHEIGRVTTIFSFEQIGKLHRALTSVEDLLTELFER
ncbi:MAG: hypothetical protein ABR577_06975 [Pyrinomonadaceae bacterium]